MTNTKRSKLSIRIVKREPLPWYGRVAVRAGAIVAALLVTAIVITLLTDANPIEVYASMFQGAFGTDLRRWSLLQGIAILLCLSLAVTPAFKMRFWNCGAEGQALVGGLASAAVMMFLGDSLSYPLLLITMFAAAVLAGVFWALLPAVCKSLWNTNETLFTLMMNYVAIQLVAFFLKAFVKNGSGVLTPMPEHGLPKLFGQDYLLNILIVALLTALVYVYLKHTKHGYEIAVVGESENTARYIGINVKKVVVRTLVVSGALCGIAGLLLVGGTNHTISTTTVGGQGFTAIMVSWLGKFNPLFMVLTTFLIVFLDKGTKQVATDFRMPNALSSIVTGIILFFIIGCEFFLQYKLSITKGEKEDAA